MNFHLVPSDTHFYSSTEKMRRLPLNVRTQPEPASSSMLNSLRGQRSWSVLVKDATAGQTGLEPVTPRLMAQTPSQSRRRGGVGGNGGGVGPPCRLTLNSAGGFQLVHLRADGWNADITDVVCRRP